MTTKTIEFNPLATPPSETVTKSPWCHFSIDDVFDSLIEVTDKNIPLFDHPLFSLLKEMHDRYGMRVGLHLFFQKEIDGKMRNLREVRDLKNELADAGGWIFFGPHAIDYGTPPYDQSPEDQIKVFDMTYDEIDRFAGKNLYARWIRLHFYSESYELADYFDKKGVTALFSTDRPVGSHRMPQEIKDNLNTAGSASYQGLHFIRTQFRVEFFADDRLDGSAIENLFRESLTKYGYIVLYTHEYELDREEVCHTLRVSCDALNRLSVPSVKTV